MSPFDYVLALALLTAPADPKETADAVVAEDALLRSALQAVAVHLEVLDPREVRYILARPEDFPADLKLLRQRCQELADAPAQADSLRFPDRETVNEFLAFNRAYRHHLDLRQSVELDRWWEHQAVLQETERLYQIWDTVRDARCEYYYVTVRRQSLARLRELLGPEDYYSGCLPPHVPLWRFQARN